MQHNAATNISKKKLAGRGSKQLKNIYQICKCWFGSLMDTTFAWNSVIAFLHNFSAVILLIFVHSKNFKLSDDACNSTLKKYVGKVPCCQTRGR